MRYCTFCSKRHRSEKKHCKRLGYFETWEDLRFSKLPPEQRARILAKRIGRSLRSCGFKISDLKRATKKLCSYGKKK